jgi:hypothetical protein
MLKGFLGLGQDFISISTRPDKPIKSLGLYMCIYGGLTISEFYQYTSSSYLHDHSNHGKLGN